MDAIDWLARVVTHIPNKREGAYSNRARGEAKKQGKDNLVPTVTENDISGKIFRKNWARLIQKI